MLLACVRSFQKVSPRIVPGAESQRIDTFQQHLTHTQGMRPHFLSDSLGGAKPDASHRIEVGNLPDVWNKSPGWIRDQAVHLICREFNCSEHCIPAYYGQD